MVSSEVPPSKRITNNQTWQTLIEFVLSVEPGSERLAEDLVTEAGQTLNCPAALLKQLKLALAKAIQNGMERHHPADSSETKLIIRVLFSAGEETAQGTERAGNKPGRHRDSARATPQPGGSAARGWGFFLVQKQSDDPHLSTGGGYELIELFLYQERDHSQKHRLSNV